MHLNLVRTKKKSETDRKGVLEDNPEMWKSRVVASLERNGEALARAKAARSRVLTEFDRSQ